MEFYLSQLKHALKFNDSSKLLEDDNGFYLRYFLEDDNEKRKVDPPTSEDWDNTATLLNFLKHFIML